MKKFLWQAAMMFTGSALLVSCISCGIALDRWIYTKCLANAEKKIKNEEK